ncbi:MAG: hypothetical protein ABSH48_24155 [Verrucomicrobiota bacterium]
MTGEQPAKTGAFVHPGLRHDEEDFKRMRTHIDREPWKSGWERLIANRHSSLKKGCEYVAKYNLGKDVPFKEYASSLAFQTTVSATGRGGLRPIWDLVYDHYVKLKGLPEPYITKMSEKVRPEGGGGDYGLNSGGYDQLG